MRLCLVSMTSAFLAIPAPVAAEVVALGENGFVSRNEAVVTATPAQTWSAMVRPADWWSGDHTYSGDAANMTLAPTAGGCFCESLPGVAGTPAGQVEHMRVIFVAPGATLRLSRGLGPLQGEAVTGVLTITIAPAGEGARIRWEYAVGGYLRMSTAQLAPLVDQVIGEQLSRLAASLAAG
jgi:hypothetical protein